MPKTKTVEPKQIEADAETFRQNLEVKRRELLKIYEHDIHVGQESSDDSADDSIDRANNSFNRELMFSLSDTERQMLILVEEAVDRLDNGGFGVCTHCDDPIGIPRLEAVPWARYCIDCQESEESGLLER